MLGEILGTWLVIGVITLIVIITDKVITKWSREE